jgi:uncharacterized protein YraI
VKIRGRVAAVALTLAVPAGIIIAAGPAQAAEVCTYKFNTSGVNIRSGPGTSYTALGEGQSGQTFTSSPATSSGSWIKGKDASTGVSGWVASQYLGSQSCKTLT